jgi:lipopolysaccharide transport system ATP-binding protein
MNDIAIRVDNLSKCYQIYKSPRDRLKQFVVPRLQRLTWQKTKHYFREFWALKDVSFEIKKGETVGIIGRIGSGKSTLLQMICGTLTLTTGNIQTHGRIAALLELDSRFSRRKKIGGVYSHFCRMLIDDKIQILSNIAILK